MFTEKVGGGTARLAKVTERLQADAPHLERPGADLIAWYLCPDQHPADRPWSRGHADTQRRLYTHLELASFGVEPG